jgi:hypothetical protein
MDVEVVTRFALYGITIAGVGFLMWCLRGISLITRRRRHPYDTESVIRLEVPRMHRQGPYANFRR